MVQLKKWGLLLVVLMATGLSGCVYDSDHSGHHHKHKHKHKKQESSYSEHYQRNNSSNTTLRR